MNIPSLMTAWVLLAQADPDMTEIAQKMDLFDFTKLTIAATVISIGFVLNRLTLATLDRLGEGQAKRRLLFKKIQSFTRLGIFVISGYLVVMTFFGGDDDNKALLGLGGTLAVAIGFALKDTTSSLMAGIFILIDQPFQVGDRVQFGDTYGEVKEIGLRSVRIVTLDDNEVSIPNNKFLTEPVASANGGALDMMVVIDFHIAMTENFDLAKQLVYEACVTSKYVFLHKPVVILIFDKVSPVAYSTIVRCKAYVIDARYERAFVSDVTERAKRAFREHEIYYPYRREYQVQRSGWDDYHDQLGRPEHREVRSFAVRDARPPAEDIPEPGTPEVGKGKLHPPT